MKKAALLFFTVAYLFTACKSHQTLKEKQLEVETGKIDESFKYTCNEVGWQTYLPKDWNLITKEENKKLNDKGKEAIKKSLGTEVDMSGVKDLVNLKKDIYNSFLSTIEKYDVTGMGNYYDHNLYVDKVLHDAYNAKKIKTEIKQGSEKIYGINFHTMEIKIYRPNSDEILLTQKMYSTLLKGYDFAMLINYNNENDRQILLKIINCSKFL